MYVFGALERVEHYRTQTGDVAVITRHQRQAIGQCSRREQAIDSRDGSDGAHAPPLIGHRVIDAEHAPIECRLYFPQPAFERLCLARVPRACKLNALSDLTKDERTQEDILIGNRRIPGGYMSVATSALSDLGNDAGIDQVAHRSTSRPGDGLRSRSIPSSGADARSAFRLTLGGSTKRCCSSLRASAWREGSDKAEATRRTRLASSLRTLTSTRTKPWRSMRARCVTRGDFALAIPRLQISGNFTGNQKGGKRVTASIGLSRRRSAYHHRSPACFAASGALALRRPPVPDQCLPIGGMVEWPVLFRNRLFQPFEGKGSRQRVVLAVETLHLDAAVVGHHFPETEMRQRGEVLELADRQVDADLVCRGRHLQLAGLVALAPAGGADGIAEDPEPGLESKNALLATRASRE